MIHLSTNNEGRTYQGSIEEVYKFMIAYNGELVPDYELSLEGKYLVRI